MLQTQSILFADHDSGNDYFVIMSISYQTQIGFILFQIVHDH